MKVARRQKRAVAGLSTVKINGQLARKPSDTIKPDDDLALTEPEKFVSRGGHKLEHALDHFKLDVSGLTAIDPGASTGGFHPLPPPTRRDRGFRCRRRSRSLCALEIAPGIVAAEETVMEKTNARELTLDKLKAASKTFGANSQLPA